MNRFATIKEIAQLLNCSAKTVRRKINKGIIPAIQPDGPGTLLRFELEEVLRAVKQGSATSPKPQPETKLAPNKQDQAVSEGNVEKQKLSGQIPKWQQKLNAMNKEKKTL